MGLDQKVLCATEKTPAWPKVVEFLKARGVILQMRMIDGQLAFPEEEPAESWNEIRIGIDGNMITLRRDPQGIQLVVWGNADPNLLRSWNMLTWALAHLAEGKIQSGSTQEAPDAFAARNSFT